jgi:hypothetical protein
MDQEDPVVLADVLKKDATLLTMDFGIVDQHPNCIPAHNPGIIIIKARPNTADLMSRMLARFKSKCPNWPELDWSEIYAEIEGAAIYVSGLTDGNISGGRTVSYTVSNFEAALTDAIAALRQRQLSP